MKTKVMLSVGVISCLLPLSAASADDQVVTLGRTPPLASIDPNDPNNVLVPDPTSTFGVIQIKDNPTAPDVLFLTVTLPELPNTRITVFQTAINQTGGLPGVLLGEFTTDAGGNGSFSVTTEIINARGSFNIDPAFAFFGVQGILPLAGAAGNGGFSIPLPFFRLYVANGNATVFGPELGGATGSDGGPIIGATLTGITP